MKIDQQLLFVGGGNMSSAILGGLVRAGVASGEHITVVDPDDAQRRRLAREFGVKTLAAIGEARADLIVWAVKPQAFGAAVPGGCLDSINSALHLSVMAGVRCEALSRLTGSERVVRAMPNTPALVGQGVSGLYAGPAVLEADRLLAERALMPTGRTLWVAREEDLDAVTALSGSGPAYFLYIIEAMIAAAVEMGLSEEQGRQLALSTCGGTAAMGLASDESPAALRERVTSRGGTTWAAIASLEADDLTGAMRRAVRAAQSRARELGDELRLSGNAT